MQHGVWNDCMLCLNAATNTPHRRWLGRPRKQVAQYGGRYRAEGTRYATRAAMLLAEYLRAIGQHGEANYIFMKAHFQVGAGRAALGIALGAGCWRGGSARAGLPGCEGHEAAAPSHGCVSRFTTTPAGVRTNRRSTASRALCRSPSARPALPRFAPGGEPARGAAAGAGGAQPAAAVAAAARAQVCLPPGAGGAALQYVRAEGAGTEGVQVSGGLDTARSLAGRRAELM